MPDKRGADLVLLELPDLLQRAERTGQLCLPRRFAHVHLLWRDRRVVEQARQHDAQLHGIAVDANGRHVLHWY